MPHAQFVQGCPTWNALNKKDLLKGNRSPRKARRHPSLSSRQEYLKRTSQTELKSGIY